MSDNPRSSLPKARQLRKALTPQEAKLWEILRNRQFEGVKFRRQQQVGYYITDFCSFEQKLIIELDGSQHSLQNQVLYDKERQKFFNDQGFIVLRFGNEEIESNLEGVLHKIKESLAPCGRGIKKTTGNID